MKKALFVFFVLTLTVSCKNDPKQEDIKGSENTEVNDAVKDISGTFMYFDDAAVFQTKSELFGVIENEMLQDLIIQSEPLKTEASDEVAVTLKVRVSQKPENEEGWDKRIEILEIKKVSKVNPNENTVIKLGKESQS